eukprot:2103681-Prymnesium_polylepis.1
MHAGPLVRGAAGVRAGRCTRGHWFEARRAYGQADARGAVLALLAVWVRVAREDAVHFELVAVLRLAARAACAGLVGAQQVLVVGRGDHAGVDLPHVRVTWTITWAVTPVSYTHLTLPTICSV